MERGTTRTYVRGGGIVATAGVARNANKYVGLRGDFIFANLPLRDSALQLGQAGRLQLFLWHYHRSDLQHSGHQRLGNLYPLRTGVLSSQR